MRTTKSKFCSIRFAGRCWPVREDVPVPLDRSIDAESTRDALAKAFGSRTRLDVLAFLLSAGPSTRGQIATELGLPGGTVYNHLKVLATIGVVHTDPPEAVKARGTRSKWTVARGRLSELYEDLGDLIAE